MTDNSTPPPPPPGEPQGGQGYTGPTPGATPVGPNPMSESEGRTYATLAHAGIAVSAFVGITLFAPLVIWLIAKDRSAFVDEQGKESLNFSILLVIAYVVGGILAIVLIGFAILLAAWVCSIIFGIMGAMAANRGEHYRYPFNLRLVK